MDVHDGSDVPFAGEPIDLRGTASFTGNGFDLTLAFSARYSCEGTIPL